MRPTLPLDIEINHFGFWRAAVLALAALVCGVMAAWRLAHPSPAPASVNWLVALGAVAAIAGALAGLRMSPLALRRRGGRWHLHPGVGPSASGELAVALDLGGWMLLRFVADATGGRTRWIPVQRRGLEQQWHELRCAVHAPRPPAPDTSGRS